MMNNQRRAGFTLIEVLVVILILALLVGLLLPAVHSAREAARRAQCANKMKQIGVAIQLHAEARNTFPAGMGSPPGQSYLVQILPYIDQKPLYDSINFETDPFGLLHNANTTALRQTPNVFQCPTDTWRSAQTEQAVNYPGNAGHSETHGEGVFIGRPLAAREIRDGLSQTAGVSEWVVGPGLIAGPDLESTSLDRLSIRYKLRPTFSDRPEDVEAFIRICEALDPKHIERNTLLQSKGQFWLEGGLGKTQYNHMLGPNRPSCVARPNLEAATVSSFHRGGAHVLTMDGGVHFIKDSVDPQVWSAIGSRSGGEVVGNSLFQ